jgi:hypothetical protein
MGVRIDGKTSVRDVDHDSLGDLKGGDAAGYFHNTSSMNTILVVGGNSGYVLSTRDSGYTPEWRYLGMANLGDPTRAGSYINGTQDGSNFYWAENYPDVSGTVFTSQGSGYMCVWTVPASTSGFAPLANPTFTGTPAAPTAAYGTNTTQLATTAFVQANKSGNLDGGIPTSTYGGISPIDCGGAS